MLARRLIALSLLALACAGFSPAMAQQGATPATVTAPRSEVAAPPVTSEAPSIESSGKLVAVGLRELSPWSMFVSAGLVVQAIIAGLIFASLVTWTTFVGKFLELFSAKRRLLAALKLTGRARSLNEAMTLLDANKSVARTFVATAINELSQSSDLDSEAGIKERAASSFAEVTRAEARRIHFGMGVLATIAATSPFVGLFGTVWGIMTSFIGISKSQTTNLAIVAPGIAEALLATAIGLFAAIPAVIIYNHFARVTKSYMELVNRASGAAGRLLSRDLDRMHALPMRRAAE